MGTHIVDIPRSWQLPTGYVTMFCASGAENMGKVTPGEHMVLLWQDQSMNMHKETEVS